MFFPVPRWPGPNGVWGEWSGEEIMANNSPIKPRFEQWEQELLLALKVQLYVFMCYSTDLCDDYNDNKLKLRKHGRILGGGLQQATKHMPQGLAITIPLTNNIRFQNITHVIVHFENAEPDLGRKGFQPEHTKLAEKLSVSAVTALRRYYDRLLRKNTGAPALMQAMKAGLSSRRITKKRIPWLSEGQACSLLRRSSQSVHYRLWSKTLWRSSIKCSRLG
jgi:hypothetical protein